MRVFLAVLIMVFAIFFQAVYAGTAQDKDFMDKAAELSYEGQLKMAEKLAGQETPITGKGDDNSSTTMFLTMIWGSIGTGYFIYGKKQSKFVFLICGVGLAVFPFFISDLVATIVLGLLMTIAPFKIEF